MIFKILSATLEHRLEAMWILWGIDPNDAGETEGPKLEGPLEINGAIETKK